MHSFFYVGQAKTKDGLSVVRKAGSMNNKNRRQHRIIAGFLTLLIVISGILLPHNGSVLLTAAQEESGEIHLLQRLSGREINPIYRDFIASTHRIVGRKLLLGAGAQEEELPPDIPYYSSLADAGADVRKKMISRTANVEIGFLSASEDWEALVEEVVEHACTHTGAPTEGDYLKFHYYQYGIDGMMYDSGNAELPYQYAFTLSFDYLSSYAQEVELSAALAVIMSGLNLNTKTEFGKAAAIYDYICSHVTYDYEHLSDTSYLLKHSCYAAVINGTAVCQGFALMLYRMLQTAGIDNRLISGKGNDEIHGWNLVRLGNRYYNADSTRDSGKENKVWFLTSSREKSSSSSGRG